MQIGLGAGDACVIRRMNEEMSMHSNDLMLKIFIVAEGPRILWS